MKEMKLRTEGIVCTGCAADMEKILRETEGVLDATVDYTADTIHIKYNPELIDRKKVFFAARKLCSFCEIVSET
ncbi:MAG: heavy-metal-associated domain-containing protein [Nitrospirae bacterium]|nr:heavy-metal-associated domain-containing protein [Nitrospirota bacterium]